MGVLQYADGLRVVWFWFDHGTVFGWVMWLEREGYSGLFGWLGFGFVASWLPGLALCWLRLTEFMHGAKWSVCSLSDCCWLRDTGLYKVRCGWVVAEFGLGAMRMSGGGFRLGAMQPGYSWVYYFRVSVLSSSKYKQTKRMRRRDAEQQGL